MSNYAAEPQTAGAVLRRRHRKPASPMKAVGTKREVWNHKAKHTSGGLTRSKLMYKKKTGAIVSIAKHKAGLKAKKYLAGYLGKISNLKKRSASKRAGSEYVDEFPETFAQSRYAGAEYAQPRYAGAEFAQPRYAGAEYESYAANYPQYY